MCRPPQRLCAGTTPACRWHSADGVSALRPGRPPFGRPRLAEALGRSGRQRAGCEPRPGFGSAPGLGHFTNPLTRPANTAYREGGTRQRRVPRTRGPVIGRRPWRPAPVAPARIRAAVLREKASGRRARFALKRAVPASKRKRLRIRSAGIPAGLRSRPVRRRAQGNRQLYAVSGNFAAVCCPVPVRTAMNAGRRPAFAAAEARLI